MVGEVRKVGLCYFFLDGRIALGTPLTSAACDG